MKNVQNKFYVLQNALLVLLGAYLILGSAIYYLFDIDLSKQDLIAPSYSSILIGVFAIIFGFSKRLISKRLGPWTNSLMVTIFEIGIVSFLFRSTGTLESFNLLIWFLIAFVAGVGGYYMNIIFFFAASIVFAMLLTDRSGSYSSIYTTAFFAGTFIVSAISYLFWQNYYDDSEVGASENAAHFSGKKTPQSLALINVIADAVVILKKDGNISAMNPAAATLSGWKAEDAENIDPVLVFRIFDKKGVELSKEDSPFKQILVSEENINQTVKLRDAKNNEHFVSIVISRIKGETKEFNGAVAVLRDVTVDKKEEEQRADFISTASHEMRTPVAAIEGYLALALNDKVSKIDSNARGYLEKAHASTQHLGKLFQDLLTSAKAEDGRLTSHPVAVELGSFLEQLAEDLKFGAEKKGLGMEFSVSSGNNNGVIDTSSSMKTVQPLFYSYVDPDRLREVITNVFDNAVKYTDKGKVSLALTGDEKVVQIKIADTGPGIPSEDVPHLFQKFYRVDNSATRAVGGTGLGLFICRKIIELYKGTIWAESKLGEGSTFFINLPRITSAKAQELKTKEESLSTVSTIPNTQSGNKA